MMAFAKVCVTYRKTLFMLCLGSSLSMLVLTMGYSSTFQPASRWQVPVRHSSITARVTRSFQGNSSELLCKNSKRDIEELSPNEKKMLYHQVIVNDKYKFMYCAVPKAACSNWKRIIRVLNGQWESVEPGRQMEHFDGFIHLSNYTTKEIEYRLKHYYKFMFVRYPFSRLLSAYKDKFLRRPSIFNDRYAAKIVNRYRPNWTVPHNVSDIQISFSEFVKFVIDSQVMNMDQHWRPMADICQPCLLNYSFIGSFENLQEDSETVFRDLGIEKVVQFPPRQSSYSGTPSNAVQDYFSQLSQKDYRRLIEKYANDFISFEYPLPDS